jgi:hypothetical protein
LLYRWDVEFELDYVVLGGIESSFSGDLDAAAWSAALQNAYDSVGFPVL